MIRVIDIRNNIDKWKDSCKARNLQDHTDEILKIDNERKLLQGWYEKIAGKLKNAAHQSPEYAMISLELKVIMNARKKVEADLEQLLLTLPNWMCANVPRGTSIKDDVQLACSGECLENDFRHENALGYDKETAINIAGARMAVFRGELAQLEWALTQWIMQEHMSAGFEYISVPCLVNEDTMIHAGKLPKFRNESFNLEDHWLISTGEIPLVCLNKQITDTTRFMTFTPCFRREAGTSGKDTQGWVRLHQFSKIELVMLTSAENVQASFDELCSRVEFIVSSLGLTWRKMHVCSGEMSVGAYNQVDFEVWMAGQRRWLEVASISDCATYQSARMNLKDKSKELVHTLNATGGVPGRLMAALIEHYYDSTDSINIPNVLQKYLNGKSKIVVSKR